MDKFSERRLVENELLFRAANQQVQQHVSSNISAAEMGMTRLYFYCECSNIHCRECMRLRVTRYNAATTGAKQFVVLPGHENRAVEKVIATNKDFTVVEKHIDPSTILQSPVDATL